MSTSIQQLNEVLLALCSSNEGSHVANQILLHQGSAWHYVMYSGAKLTPRSYNDAASYSRDNLCLEFLRKLELDDSENAGRRHEQAVKSFHDANEACYVTNARFIRFQNQQFENAAEAKCCDYLVAARTWIKRVLGFAPSIFDVDYKYGPGTTLGLKDSRLTNKLTAKNITSTPANVTVFGDAMSLIINIGNTPLSYVPGNRFAVVPKDSQKDRGICVEPLANTGFQLGMGAQIRKRLQRRGYLVKGGEYDSQVVHRRAARNASLSRRYATIDLSQASDLVSKQVVKYLLPTDWYELLDSLRSPYTSFDGKQFRNEMFSSMGCGFTFDLETLIFASLCSIFTEKNSVFGDDIIVPTEVVQDVMAMLTFCGFKVNKHKSFYDEDDPFRESCGGDYWNGMAVRAHYVKKDPSCPSDWFSVCNGLRRYWSNNPDCELFHESWVFPAYVKALCNIPVHLRKLKGPEHLGDLVLHAKYYETSIKKGVIGVFGLHAELQKDNWKHIESKYYFNLYSCLPPSQAGEYDRGLALRDRVQGYRVKFTPLINPDQNILSWTDEKHDAGRVVSPFSILEPGMCGLDFMGEEGSDREQHEVQGDINESDEQFADATAAETANLNLVNLED